MSVISKSPLHIQTEPVHRWRLEQLLAAGYPPRDAQVLSDRADVDLHLAVRLLEAGCPVDTALRILL
jgi:hypothetical protein